MSLCCFPSLRGSGQKKAQNEICACGRRNPNKPHRRLPSTSGRRTRRVTVGIPGKEYPSQAITWVRAGKAHTSYSSFRSSSHDVLEKQVDRFIDASNGYRGQVDQTRKSVQCQTENSEEDITEVVTHGPGYTTYQVRVQVNQADDTVQCLSESSNQDIIERLVNGFNYSTFLYPGKVHQATDTIQGWTQCAADFKLRLHEACRMRALQKGTLEKVAASMVPAFPPGNIPHICTLMAIHPAFSRAQGFLEELLTRSCPPLITSDAIKVFCTSGGIPPHNDRGDTPQEQLAKATTSVMGTWPDRVQYLGQPLLSPWFIVKQALVLHSRPAPHPVGLIRSLWVELEHLEPTEAQWEEPPPELKRTPEPEEEPAPGLEPGPAVVVLEPSVPPALIRIPTAEPIPSPTTDYRRAGTPKHFIKEEKLNIVTFPPRLVAEQLTAMDAELFKKVLPHQCLGSIWSQRTKPGKGHVASTVSATVRQFNHVATCVITTCLGDPSMMAQERAKVVEHWIKVAKECRSLRNFSSLHAILAALQSLPIHRLAKTWGEVSRRWAVTLNKLCKKDNSLSREQLIKPSRYATLMLCLRGSKKGMHKKCVPFLGRYLKDLKLMDTRMEDDLEGNQINIERKEKVQRVLEEIVVLQEAAQRYNIEPEEQFRAWFWALKRLSENESYIQSCQLEPQS